MISRAGFFIAATMLSAACNAESPRQMLSAPPGAVASSTLRLDIEPVFGGREFDRPIAMYQAPGETAWYVVEQAGRVLRLPADTDGNRATVFIDMRRRVDDGPNEAGLLGLAFHPDYEKNRYFYVSYTGSNGSLHSVISRLTATGDGRKADPSTERLVLTIAQPYGNHNGGQIAFGPDGYLYAGYGDGGAGGDPQGHGQDTQTLLGAMLRIDVNGKSPYAIPPDNPFARGGGRPEIFAWGLRNPWRWSFDRKTGALWAGDVGQNRYEEIDIIRKGENYGWNIREAASDYGGGDRSGLTDPVAQYGHSAGCSVTGGYVYRGTAIPALHGVYIFGDYCSGRIWGLKQDNGAVRIQELIDTDLRISSFAEGQDGTLYVLDHGGGVFRLVAGRR